MTKKYNDLKSRRFLKPIELKPPTPQPKRTIHTIDRMAKLIDISKIHVQWIHQDDRGEIFCFYKDGKEYTVLTTKKGFARGGCMHKLNREFFVVLKGRVEYHFIYDFPRTQIFNLGESGQVARMTPHYYVALEDSITLEWGATIEEKKEKHKPTRRIVEKINEDNLR